MTPTALPESGDGSGPEWAGFSVTMPGKSAAAAVADERSPRVAALGVANTLVRRDGGWFADNTDVDGLIGALRAAGRPAPRTALILGGGGTAASVIAALAELGATDVVIAGRRPQSTAGAVELGRDAGAADPGDRLGARRRSARRRIGADLVVSTVPAGAADALADRLAGGAGPVRRAVPPVADAAGRRGSAGPDHHYRSGHVAASGFSAVRVDHRGAARRSQAMRQGLLDGSGTDLPLPV